MLRIYTLMAVPIKYAGQQRATREVKQKLDLDTAESKLAGMHHLSPRPFHRFFKAGEHTAKVEHINGYSQENHHYLRASIQRLSINYQTLLVLCCFITIA